MKMVRSDLAASGVAFTLDTESGFRDVVLVNASYGLGENIVQGAVEPDELPTCINPTFEAEFRTVLRRKLGSKRLKMIYGDAQEPVRNTDTTEADSDRQCISDEDVLTIAGYAINVERHYGGAQRRAASDGFGDGLRTASTADVSRASAPRKRASCAAHDRHAA